MGEKGFSKKRNNQFFSCFTQFPKQFQKLIVFSRCYQRFKANSYNNNNNNLEGHMGISNPITTVGTVVLKYCPSCKHRKRLEDFWKRLKSRDGLTSRCKECLRLVNAEAAYWRRKASEREGRHRKPTGEETWVRRIQSDAVKSVLASKLWPFTKDANKSIELAESLMQSLATLTFDS